jgi:hypothetical protein
MDPPVNGSYSGRVAAEGSEDTGGGVLRRADRVRGRRRAASRPPVHRNPIQVENARPGLASWTIPDAANHAVEGYASELALAPGDTLQLHVSTDPAAPYRIEVYRLGWYGGRGARLVACVPSDCAASEPGAPQPVPARRGAATSRRWA